jgi:toxin ParE1/3/4
MGSYRQTEDAKADLIRIYRRGLREYAEVQADAYYGAFFDRFEQIAKLPLLYAAVDHVRVGYRRSVCGRDSIYYRVRSDTIETMAIIGLQTKATLPVPAAYLTGREVPTCISTRRFCARPSSVSLLATGSLLPFPTTSTMPASMPSLTMKSLTASARRTDNS